MSLVSDSPSRLVLITKLHGHNDPVWAIRWRPGTHQLVSCSGKSLLLWDRKQEINSSIEDSNGLSLWTLKSVLYNEEEKIDISDPTNNRIQKTEENQENYTIHYSGFNVYVNGIERENAGVHSRTIRNVAWSSEGKYLAAASFDATVSLWMERPSCQVASSVTEKGKGRWVCFSHLEGHENEVKCVAWSPISTELVTCSRDKTVWIHSLPLEYQKKLVNEKDCVVEFACAAVLTGHTQDVKCVVWHPTENLVFSASYDNTIRLWGRQQVNRAVENVEQVHCSSLDSFSKEYDWECLDTLTNHTSTVWEISFSPNGESFVSCSDDRTLCIWTRRTELMKPSSCSSRPVSSISSQQDPKSFLAQNSSGKNSSETILYHWLMVQPGFKPVSYVLQTDLIPPHETPCLPEKFKEMDCTREVPLYGQSLTMDPIVDKKNYQKPWYCTCVLSNYHSRTIYSVAWHPTLNIIASACSDNALRIFRLEEEILLDQNKIKENWCLDLEVLNAHKNDVNSVRWKTLPESDGSWLLATAGDDRVIQIYRYTTNSFKF